MDGVFYFSGMDIQKLHDYFSRSTGACTDSRKIFEGCMFFALKGPSFNGNTYAAEALEKGASFAIIDEEAYHIDGRTILVEDVLKALQELGTFHRRTSGARIIALTGSNGKTTTKELLREVIGRKYRTIATQGNLNNHIGVPLTLLRLKKDTEVGIIEMGANHQKEIAFLSRLAEPDMGLITNYGKAHLEGFGGVEGVIKGKSELYDFLKEQHHPIFFNADDPIQLEKLRDYTKKYGYSRENQNFYRINLLAADPFVKLEAEGTEIQTQLSGTYNFQNCAIALMVGKYLNVPMEEIKLALEQYVPSNNRSQWIETDRYKILMDAYNANPSSMSLAVENFARLETRPKIAILGDMFELGTEAATEHQAMADLALNAGLDEVFLVGDNFFQTKGSARRYRDYKSLEEALKADPLPESTLLIKGSRGMALERLMPLFGAGDVKDKG